MDIENVEENTDRGSAGRLPATTRHHAAIGGRNGHGADGDEPLRIAKKPRAECAEQE